MKRLYRSRKEKRIAGVCGGVGQYFNIDPVIVRVVFLMLMVFGVGIALYLIMWLIVPLEY